MEPQFENISADSSGPIFNRLANCDFDLGHLRPYREEGRKGSFVCVNTGKTKHDGTPKMQVLTSNAVALLSREDWQSIDKELRWQAKQQLRVAKDIYSANPVKLKDGFSILSLQHWLADGDADAILSMDGVRQSERSKPDMKPVSIPLPIIHSDGNFTARQVAVSRRAQMPLQTTNIKLAARKINEVIERLTLGVSNSYSFGGGTIYGLTNLPQRNTYAMLTPEGGGYAYTTLRSQLSDMIKILEDQFYYGPYTLYYSNAWGPHLDADYVAGYPKSVRSRMSELTKITKMVNADYLTGFTMILVQMTSDVVDFINGMPITTVQWEEAGGQQLNFKTMGIQVPRVMYDYAGHTGIVVGTTAVAPTTTTSTTTTTTTTT